MNSELLYTAIREERELAIRRAQLLAQALGPDVGKRRPDSESAPRQSTIARLVQAVARASGV